MVSSLISAGRCTYEFSYREENVKCPTVNTNMFIHMCVCVYTHMADGEGEDAKCFNNGVLQIFGKCDKCIEKMCNNNS